MGANKAYKGIGMNGPIATWYTKNTGRGERLRWFVDYAKTVADSVAPGGRVLEVAPGPGFLAIEIAKAGRHRVTGLDVSESFVRIAREQASNAGVAVDFRQGNASAMPFLDSSFDFVVCTAAFKNFSDPIGALNEIYRVLAPGGCASIFDLRKDASLDAIATEVRSMHLSAVSALFTRGVFRFSLLRRAYTRETIETLVAQSLFGTCQFKADGIGFELQLTREGQAGMKASRAHTAV
jgi:ubiquinone/menaquinone biosynthesis C-methylase UbiE